MEFLHTIFVAFRRKGWKPHTCRAQEKAITGLVVETLSELGTLEFDRICVFHLWWFQELGHGIFSLGSTDLEHGGMEKICYDNMFFSQELIVLDSSQLHKCQFGFLWQGC